MTRPTPMLAGLALAAAVILAACSSAGAQPPTDPPAPTPVASPSPAPSLGPAPTPVTVSIIDALGKGVTATIEDASGRLVRATSAQPSDGGVVEGGVLAVTNDGPNRLRLEWTDLPCATAYGVTIDASGSAIAVTREACGGDTLPVDRILVLEFGGPIDAAGVTGTVDLPIQGEE